MTTRPVFLDVDPSIVEKNLRVTENNDVDIDKIFNIPGEEYPSKLVKPVPGFCVKTKEIGTDSKVFINVCKTNAIPAPKHITENELSELLDSDEVTEYKVPMSIGEMRTEKDKKGDDSKVCDIAINENFFTTVETSPMFRNFVMAVIFEAISEKHKVFVTDERTLMKHRKAFGTLQMHRIQDRAAAEVKAKDVKNLKSPLIEEIASSGNENEVPKYILYKKNDDDKCFYADVKLPKIASSKEITLDVGEDRLILESKSKKYLLDIFIPFNVDQSNVKSCFNIVTKILVIKMSILH